MRTILENWRKYTSGEVPLYHFSTADARSLILDPEYFLTKRNMYSRNDFKVSAYPRVFFYTDLDNTEEQVSSGATLYSATVSGDQIYDILEDPEDLRSVSRGPYGLALNYDELFQNIVDQGYNGAYYTISGGKIGVVVWFEPIEVFKVTEEI